MSAIEYSVWWCFIIAFGIQQIYNWIIFGRFAFCKIKLQKTHVQTGVSVVIACRNELENLKTLVPVLLMQDYPCFELIFIDDRSEDHSTNFLESITDSRLQVISIKNKPKDANGKKYALLHGIQAAKHDIILLTDADCLPRSKAWIRMMQQPFHQKSTEIVLGYSPYKTQSGFLNVFIQYETLYTAIQYFSFACWKSAYMGVGRNLAYRKSLFLQKKGFENTLNIIGGDDDLWIGKAATPTNTAIVIDKNTQTYSKPPYTWNDWFEQKKRHLSVSKHYALHHQLKLGLLHLSHLLFVVLGVGFVFFSKYMLLVLVFWGLHILGVGLCFWFVGRKLGTAISVFFVVILDFLYLVYIIITGIAAFTTKITWTKTKKDSFLKRRSKTSNS